MIATFFLTILYGLVSVLVGFLPTGHLPTTITTAFATMFGLLNVFSFVVPVGTLIAAALVVLIFDGALMLWYSINWIIRKIPGMQ